MYRQNSTVMWCAAWSVVLAVLVTEYAMWWARAEPPALAQFAATRTALTGRSSVIDGDTIEMHGQRIRIWGVDAPEHQQPCRISGKTWRCGQRAALALSDWIGHRPLACEMRDKDQYQRIVATCQVGGNDVGAWLVRSGWALDYSRYSQGTYAADQQHAAAAKLGIWQGEFDMPWDWRHRANL